MIVGERQRERLAVHLAIRKADAACLAELQAVIRQMAAQSVNSITEPHAAELDLRFHENIYLAADHRRLIEVWSSLRPQIHILLLTRNVVNSDFREGLVKGHQSILDAIVNKDEPLALSLTGDHLKASYERVSRSYVQHAAMHVVAAV